MNYALTQLALNSMHQKGIALAKCFELPQGPVFPEWIELIPANDFTGKDGRSWVNRYPSVVVEAKSKDGRDIPFDIEHSTEIKGPKGEEAPAFSWITELDVRDGAVFGRVDWSEAGTELVTSRKYRYYSPAFFFDSQGSVLKISSVAFTNKPNLDFPALNQEQTDMKLSALIAQALALNSETATEQDAVTAINQLKSDHQLALNRAENPDLTKYIPTETHQLALNRAETAEQKLKEIEDGEVEALVDGAIADGKIAPANKEMYLATCRADRKGFESFIQSAPVIASSESKHDKKPGGDESKLTDGQLALCHQLGLTEKEFLAAKKQ